MGADDRVTTSVAPAVPSSGLPRYGAGAIATVAATGVYLLATSIEIAVIERLRPGEMELTWISDAVLAVAFGFAVFLWLHLKWTRLTLSRLQREHIVLDPQLALAADIQRGLLPPLPPDGAGVRWAAPKKPMLPLAERSS